MASKDQLRAIRALLEAFIAGEDRSLSAAGRIEVALDEAFPNDDQVQDCVTMFASYRPEGGDYLYSAEQIVPECLELMDLLNELMDTSP